MQLKVIKADGSVEEYLHTKVIGTFSNVLASVDQPNIFAAEQFADAITFHLYQKRDAVTVTSEEIHLMIQAVLTATGYGNASRSLNKHHLNRRLKRKRIEVFDDGDGNEASETSLMLCQWDKSRIVDDLVQTSRLGRHIARAIASAVEEKVLNMGITRVRHSLIKVLVQADTEAMLNAQKQLETVKS